MIKCTICLKKKPLTEFYLRKSGRRAGTYHPYCKSCCREIRKKYYKKNKAQEDAKHKQWLKDNPKYTKDSYIKHQEKIRHKQSQIYSSNPDKYRAIAREQSRKHRDRIKEYSSKHANALYEQARHAIEKISPKSHCELCGRDQFKIHGHHFSYHKRHHKDVLWICASCHKCIHNPHYHPKLFLKALEMWIDKFIHPHHL